MFRRDPLPPTDGKRYVVRSDEKLTAFLETEKVTRNAHDH
jgi:hypothetical protein